MIYDPLGDKCLWTEVDRVEERWTISCETLGLGRGYAQISFGLGTVLSYCYHCGREVVLNHLEPEESNA